MSNDLVNPIIQSKTRCCAIFCLNMKYAFNFSYPMWDEVKVDKNTANGKDGYKLLNRDTL